MSGTVEGLSAGGDGSPSGTLSVSKPLNGIVRVSLAGHDSVGFYGHVYQFLTRAQLEEHINHCASALLDMMSDTGR